jgi:S1-C subfamily serine protease
MGYSFAIPANLTKKVIGDLMEYGTVQRAFIGVSIQNISNELAEQIEAPTKDGIYVAGLSKNGSAEDAGIKKGDIITKINGSAVKNVPELQERVSRYRPGDKITVGFLRNKTYNEVSLVLRNQFGNTEMVDHKTNTAVSKLGAQFSPVPDKTKKRLNISTGVQVSELMVGKLMKSGVREQFIILKIDGKNVKSPNDLIQTLSNKKGGVLLEGIYPNGQKAYYGIGL